MCLQILLKGVIVDPKSKVCCQIRSDLFAAHLTLPSFMECVCCIEWGSSIHNEREELVLGKKIHVNIELCQMREGVIGCMTILVSFDVDELELDR